MANLYSGAGGGAGTMAMVRGNRGQKGPGRDASDLGVESYGTREVLRRLWAYVRPH